MEFRFVVVRTRDGALANACCSIDVFSRLAGYLDLSRQALRSWSLGGVGIDGNISREVGSFCFTIN